MIAADRAAIAPEAVDRRRFVGGSDIAGILGLQPRGWKTAVQIWQRKTMPDAAVEPETQQQVRKRLARGHVVEPLVATLLEHLHGIKAIVRSTRYVDPEVPYFAAEVDAQIPFGAVSHLFDGREGVPVLSEIDGNEIVNVEIKTVHPFAAGEWGEEGSDDVPIHYAAQVQWGLGVTGRRFALVAALFGADSLVLYPMVADHPTIAGMRERAAMFWRFVEAKEPPPPQTLDDCALLWPRARDVEVEATDEIAAAVKTLAGLRKRAATFDEGADGVAVMIREHIKDATTLTVGGEPVATLKEQGTTSIDTDLLKTQFPEAYKAALRKGTTRVLRLTKGA